MDKRVYILSSLGISRKGTRCEGRRPWAVKAEQTGSWGGRTGGGRRLWGLRMSRGGCSPVAVAVVVLQQQLLAEADLLQLLAQFVQLAGQPLTLQLLQHQFL